MWCGRQGRRCGSRGRGRFVLLVLFLALAGGLLTACDREKGESGAGDALAPTSFPVDADAWRARPDVTTRPSGLAYRVLKRGTGAAVPPGAMVTVHYEGRFLDGRVFDSSYARGQPARFRSDRLIPGWVEALSLMHEGDKWELLIPARLGYGARGAGNVIPPDTPLFFTVELIRVEAEPPADRSP